MTTHDICIVGGGWAGLSAAVRLTEAGRRVTVLEATRHLGGRARRVDRDGMPLDNGQHLLLGAYEHTLRLMKTLGMEESRAFMRLPLDLNMREAGAPGIGLASFYLPAPLHLLAGLLSARGMPGRDRLRALPGLARLMRWQQDEDISVSRLLHEHGQPEVLVRGLWEPLCLATLNTPLTQASAKLFCAVLRGAFSGHRSHADLLVPRMSLGDLLPKPAHQWLDARGVSVRTLTHVCSVIPTETGFTLALRDGETLDAHQVVLATAHPAAARLLKPLPSLKDVTEGLEALETEPICTVYLQYPESVRLQTPFFGMLGTTAQWTFDRRITGQPGLMAVVISASGPHMQMDNQALVAQVRAELHMLFPDWPFPLKSWVIREKQATFRAAVDCDRLRPGNTLPQPGLWLAGDYTLTGLPATLEGAVISGLQCAQAILQQTPATTETQ
ncbi:MULTISPECIES: hydroxysqualene dehydroxylase HpnE [unclassified Ectothiorhodospira]|uniref:hydroxysqualene dehydroxylase HpnE n=1 Tax=unclassified Ectothiorhodospira TaxID=2684909 RepID=UPI001EE81B99|nr:MULTISPECIES: hydroxysqualene dehydroxylase HpnE [unclassified Ectothiorhodospira]MCG5515537.1 hydroxysqualene dehydroxylase HpnE [Ectothiorhodospira sp. 9100]MCG5518696.1 hydroxysqualene dehydroxylase HpnE [Ectothiorhodospira sp. 9905]